MRGTGFFACGIWIALSWCGCGSGGGHTTDLTIYAGHYTLTETFRDQTGTKCPPPPVNIVTNGVQVSINKNQVQGVFDTRWGTLKGEVQDDLTFLLSGSLGSTETLAMTGSFAQDKTTLMITLTGLMKDIKEGCTLQFDMVGERTSP